MLVRHVARAVALAVLAVTLTASSAAAQGYSVQFGPTFADFGDDVDFDNKTGFHLGFSFETKGVVGFETEINWIRKQAKTALDDVSIDYLQIPTLFRVNAGTDKFRLYGLGGPAFAFKIGEDFEGSGFIDDPFESFDFGIVFGGGMEIYRVILEGRYEKGLRDVIDNDLLNDLDANTKGQSFTLLIGFRFK